MQNFQEKLGTLLKDYCDNVFAQQLEILHTMREENEIRFGELSPQMQAINQIRDIYRQSLAKNYSFK